MLALQNGPNVLKFFLETLQDSFYKRPSVWLNPCTLWRTRKIFAWRLVVIPIFKVRTHKASNVGPLKWTYCPEIFEFLNSVAHTRAVYCTGRTTGIGAEDGGGTRAPSSGARQHWIYQSSVRVPGPVRRRGAPVRRLVGLASISREA